MPRWITLAVVVCLIAGLARPAMAWSRKGHRLIGRIAKQRLAEQHPQVLRAIRKLIGPRTSLAELSTCADDIRDYTRWPDAVFPDHCIVTEQELRTRYANTSPWHFVNILFETRAGHPARELERACASSCITAQIDFFSAQLKDNRLSNRTRAVALMFLAHLTGDVHQPLHTISRSRDAGGNFVYVKLNGKVMTLHSLWDTLPIESRREHPINRDHDTPESWAWESFDDARTIAYRNVPNTTNTVSDPIILPADYRSRAEACIERRLFAAGVRLADVLAKLISE